MKIIFDSSAVSPLLANNAHAITVLSQQTYDYTIIPLATDAEQRFGFAHGTRQVDNLTRYERFKSLYRVEIVAPDQETAIIYAELANYARQNGYALGQNDLWIAATSVQYGGVLMAADEDFTHLPQVRLLAL